MKHIKKKFNKYMNIQHCLLSRVCDVHPCCVFMHVCFVISLLSVYMCVRMPLSSRSIVGVPSSRQLLDYPITAHNLCVFLM